MMSEHAEEIRTGRRFAFGRNWAQFLNGLDDARIKQAQQSLCAMLEVDDLRGKQFLDAGSGSGLFSLAARQLGATVVSFDYDPASVACTNELRRRYYADDAQWRVTPGSVLDGNFLTPLGTFDVVYSWGVLHHTGNMYAALANVMKNVAPRGRLFIAIYNDQGWISRYWSAVKRLYNKSAIGRWFVIVVHAPYLLGLRWLVRTASGRRLERGMDLWHDMLDWLGGYPFEVAKPERILSAVRAGGFSLDTLKTCGGRMGCNEFVFRREDVDDK